MNEIEIVGVDSYDNCDFDDSFDTSWIVEDEGKIIIRTGYDSGFAYTGIDLFQLVNWIDSHRELIADLKERSK
ncbi:hypothetical protein [Streptococcus parauberis]|uniref:hypothetical protein n=1 Tax=Streptococcus parauberis TaxID=1348 RepID=UPI000789B78A|nr:hypothetical protein [Streptococcus parauberis]KYP17736.1 hypothetical protein TN39_01947 [Streptococcus parauberis]KYP18609.1 hypothetical protein AKL14_00895 [Streptococcus parauberis]KYP20012.1 hypothetical protein AKL13_00812 [Streptococcus parauberis]KYP27343.1 hypothetical protein TM50_00649 [Streptococcus parauberis]KYP27609.1 hypothetical protein TP84_00478 [Streptococcus parauberis]